MQSFTYGRKLKRKKISKAERERMLREQEEERERQDFLKRLNILKEKKAKSIGGDDVGLHVEVPVAAKSGPKDANEPKPVNTDGPF
mmetsp:Transcript_26254/g.19711  ORF Transcript_26254/g.19711 Transcript_26254/m.19711 type:complete len:86 (+) Transcript_26254:263-520(+)